MLEVELKYSVTEVESLRKKIKNCFAAESRITSQVDQIYLQEGVAFDDLVAGHPILRLRRSGTNTTATVKKYVEGTTVRVERNMRNISAEEAASFFDLIGFKRVVTVRKQREQYSVKDMSICIDVVEGLGSFIEIEKLSHEEGVTKCELLCEIRNMANILGLNESEIVTTPYDQAIANLNDKV